MGGYPFIIFWKSAVCKMAHNVLIKAITEYFAVGAVDILTARLHGPSKTSSRGHLSSVR